MPRDQVLISMTTFGTFVVADPLAQLASVREVRRQYDSDYLPGGDFWSRWREQVEKMLRLGQGHELLDEIWQTAKDNRGDQYRSACSGYQEFWGRKRMELLDHPKPAHWQHDRLVVRVNPEWRLRINGKDVIVKLHLKDKLPLNQRLANPLLYLLDKHFGPAVGGCRVAILDVHRGHLWHRRTESDLEAVLRMQAAAFLAGWATVGGEEAA